jgi:hypothetical protein
VSEETIEADENKFNLGGATLSKVYPVSLILHARWLPLLKIKEI